MHQLPLGPGLVRLLRYLWSAGTRPTQLDRVVFSLKRARKPLSSLTFPAKGGREEWWVLQRSRDWRLGG